MFVFVLVPLLILLGVVLILAIPLTPVVVVALVAALIVHRHHSTKLVKSVHSY